MSAWKREPHFLRKVLEIETTAFREDYGTLRSIFQFANNPGPTVSNELIGSARREAARLASSSSTCLGQK